MEKLKRKQQNQLNMPQQITQNSEQVKKNAPEFWTTKKKLIFHIITKNKICLNKNLNSFFYTKSYINSRDPELHF